MKIPQPPPEKILFEEKQFLGMNRLSLLLRTIVATFCFVTYYWSENPKPVSTVLFDIGAYPGDESYGNVFFVMGLGILILSALLLFVLHIRTTMTAGALLVDGLWTSRRVRIELSGIVAVRKIHYKPSILRRPVYNLYSRGRVVFYTRGRDAVELTTSDGLIYRIGTQRADELLNLLAQAVHN